jgi:uncharacterized phage-like protein YoqJ
MRYKNYFESHSLNIPFWEEVLVGKTIKELKFSQLELISIILDNGEEVFLRNNSLMIPFKKEPDQIIVGITGHRPNKINCEKLPNPTYIKICQEIEKHLLELKPYKVISGMALGVDSWFVNISLKLNIPFIAAIPFKGQETVWKDKDKKIYNKFLEKAEDIVIVSSGGYSKEKMQVRNEYIVDNCDVLIAVFNSELSGGTANCVKYAEEKKRKIIFINPHH